MRAVDLFAGLGGMSEGARLAGLDVVWAANHSPLAVDTHAANHRSTIHACQDLNQADWSALPEFDVLLASPCCQGHTNARGKDRPHHDASRQTAFAVVACLEYHRPRLAIIENVPEFLAWKLLPAWTLAMELMGYKLSHSILDAADFGVPQNRERLFLTAVLDQPAIGLDSPELVHVGADSFIDWESGSWGPVSGRGNRTRAPATLARVARGRAAFGDRFVMPYYGSGSGLTGRDIKRPLGTVTCKARWGLVWGDMMRMLTPQEYRAAMGFREGYILPRTGTRSIELLGNAVCPPQAAGVITQALQGLN